MNRQSRRHPSSSYLPAFHASKKCVVPEQEKRKNTAVNTVMKKRKNT